MEHDEGGKSNSTGYPRIPAQDSKAVPKVGPRKRSLVERSMNRRAKAPAPLTMMFRVFLARTDPDSTSAKPTCRNRSNAEVCICFCGTLIILNHLRGLQK
jgi:hypothetical protein